MRTSTQTRTTTETAISLTLNLDGTGRYDIDTGCGFFNHMLELFCRHGRFDLSVRCKGDIQVDCHHTVEDVGIVLGTAFREALGDCGGINRYGFFLLPMDEALCEIAVDLGGRCTCACSFDFSVPKVGDFDAELAEEFLLALSRSMPACIHVRQLAGRNTHHILEACFKGLGRALRQAVAVDPALRGEIPSTKGVL